MNTKITFLLALINGANLRPSTRSDQLGYKPSTRRHGFICSTGNERSQLGITYDKKGRYYSISYHNVCPNPEMKDWKCNADYKQCKNGTTYHCARDSITGKFTDACALPVFCGRGKEPLIQFPEGIPRIICRLCERNHFNDVNKSSDTYSVCYKKITCRKYEEIECGAAEGNASYWTQRSCKCNWKLDFIPTDLETRKPGEKFCTERAKCTQYKCNNTADGKRQERLSDYSCVPVCDPGSHRINESADCVSTGSENITVAVHELTTETPISLSKTDATTDKTTNAKTTKLPASTTHGLTIGQAIGIIASICIVIAVVGFVIWWWCWKKRRRRHVTNAPGTPKYVNSTYDNIEIEWTKPNASENEDGCFIDRYIIEMTEVGSNEMKRKIETLNESYIFTNLKQDTEYKFRVATFHRGKVGTFSDYSDPVRTQLHSRRNHETNVPGIPECVKSTKDSIEVNWTKPKPFENETEYSIEMTEVNNTEMKREIKSLNNSCTFTNLKPGTEYVFRVATFHNGKAGTFSEYCAAIRTQMPSVTSETSDDVKYGEVVSTVNHSTGTPTLSAKRTKNGLAVEEEEGHDSKTKQGEQSSFQTSDGATIARILRLAVDTKNVEECNVKLLDGGRVKYDKERNTEHQREERKKEIYGYEAPPEEAESMDRSLRKNRLSPSVQALRSDDELH